MWRGVGPALLVSIGLALGSVAPAHAELRDSPFYKTLFEKHPPKQQAAPLVVSPADPNELPLLRRPAVRILAPRNAAESFAEAFPAEQFPRSTLPRTGGYRTMCVRLCDGFYWPVRYGADSSQLVSDDRVCQSECGADARMFYQPIGSSGPDDLRDLNGKPYAKLANALRYRKVFDPQCRCHADPWSPVERIRHEDYGVGAAGGPKGLQVEKAAGWNMVMAVEPSFVLAASDLIRGAVPAVSISNVLPEVVRSEVTEPDLTAELSEIVPAVPALPKFRRVKPKVASLGLNDQPPARLIPIKVAAPGSMQAVPQKNSWFSLGKPVDFLSQLGIKGR